MITPKSAANAMITTRGAGGSGADRGLLDRDAVRGHRLPEAEVAHHRHRDRIVRERTALFHPDREYGEDLVAVDDVAGRVDGKAAVRVAVVRDPGVGTGRGDRRL